MTPSGFRKGLVYKENFYRALNTTQLMSVTNPMLESCQNIRPKVSTTTMADWTRMVLLIDGTAVPIRNCTWDHYWKLFQFVDHFWFEYTQQYRSVHFWRVLRDLCNFQKQVLESLRERQIPKTVPLLSPPWGRPCKSFWRRDAQRRVDKTVFRQAQVAPVPPVPNDEQ